MPEERFYEQCLKSELASRCERNAGYSLRTFAKAMEIDVGTVSKVLAGKKIPSYKLAQRILRNINLYPEQESSFFISLAEAHRERGLKRLNPALKKMTEPSKSPREMAVELARALSDWYHVAILELTLAKGFRADAKWIAARLGITPTEARLAVERLLQIGLLVESEGRLIKRDLQLTTADKHVTTPALRRRQRQMLEKAAYSLENDPIDSRSMTSMTMTVDPQRIPGAKRMISEFNQKLAQYLEAGERTQVYELGIALYPLSKGESSS